MKRLAAFLFALAAGCGDREPTALANQEIAPTPAPAAGRDPAQRLAAAVRAAFPRGELAAFDDEPAREFDEHKLVDTPFGPVLVSNGHMPEAAMSHAPGGLIAIHYLDENDSGFAVRSGFPKTYELGSFGRLGEWAVSEKFSDFPTVYAQGGGTFQGYSCGRFKLIELQPRGPIEVADVPDGYDDSGAVEAGAQSIEGKIADIVKGKAFTVRYGGTRSFAERYTRRGDRYAIDGGRTQLPEC